MYNSSSMVLIYFPIDVFWYNKTYDMDTEVSKSGSISSFHLMHYVTHAVCTALIRQPANKTLKLVRSKELPNKKKGDIFRKVSTLTSLC